MNNRLQTIKYIVADIIAAILSWTMFFNIREKLILKSNIPFIDIITSLPFSRSLIITTAFWFILYTISGNYHSPYRRSRLGELGKTLLTTIIGSIIIIFALILKHNTGDYLNYNKYFIILFFLHFTLTYTLRLIITSITAYKIQHRIIGFNTLIIGCGTKAYETYNEIENLKFSYGNKFIGFVSLTKDCDHNTKLKDKIPYLGEINNINDVIKKYSIEEVIIAIEPHQHNELMKILNILYETYVIIKVSSDIQDILLGKVKMTAIFNYPLIEITYNVMPDWQLYIKNIMDIIVSFIALILLSPLFIVLGIGVKLSSKGPIFYSHERIGLHGNPFKIYKFRSMYIDAEKEGPALSSKYDPRVTKFGRFMRKTRLDEIPQFYNVLRGDMSLVGPRPERQYYIDQIIKIAPHYKLLLKVKPGITSWGQVKYGYAENVEQMIQRLKYDVLYVQNMSLFLDFKIIIYTIIRIFQARGK